MGTVIFDTSMSLDGFMAAANRSPEEPLGDGGERLHEWAMGRDERNRDYFEVAIGALGAVICGRTTYDDSVPWWGANGPTGGARRPVFVVTHEPPADSPAGGVYSFVDGIEAALARAQAAAGDKDVTVMGGASIGQQFLTAGLVDEISIHLVPVLFGTGTRMFEHLGGEQVELEKTEVIETPTATHLRFRIAAG
jgi:dihydrofolate reductase